MSHLDARAEFSDAQAVTATAISTNVMDRKGLGLAPNATDNIGAPATMYLVVSAGQAATASGAATVTVTLESADNAALSSNPVVHFSSGAIPLAGMTAGARMVAIPLPAGDYKEFLGVRYTVATGPLTGGTFNAYLTLDPSIWRAYEDGKPESP